MKKTLKKVLLYELPKEREVGARPPVISGTNLLVSFYYRKKDSFGSTVACLSRETFEPIWEYKTDRNGRVNDPLVSSHGSIICAYMALNKIISLDAKTGEVLWEWDADDTDNNLGFVSNECDGKIVVGGLRYSKSAWCIDTKTGKQLWKYDGHGEHIRAPRIVTNAVFLFTVNNLDVVSLKDGKEIYTESDTAHYYTARPVAVGDMAIGGGYDLLRSYDSSNGKGLDKLKIERESDMQLAVTEDSTVIVGQLVKKDDYGKVTTGGLSSISVSKEGKMRMQWDLEAKSGITAPPLSVNGVVYAVTRKGALLGVDAANGTLLSETNIKHEGNGICTDGEFLYVAAEKSVFKFQL